MEWPHTNSPAVFQCTMHWRPDSQLESAIRQVARSMGKELMFAAPVRQGALVQVRPGFDDDEQIVRFKQAVWTRITGESSSTPTFVETRAPGAEAPVEAGRTQNPPRVFISYAQESAAHSERVLALADKLRGHGVEAWIDRYVPAPVEGWPQWMDIQIASAEFILAVCSPAYRRRMEGTEAAGKGLGATWESRRLVDELYAQAGRNKRVIPVIFSEDAADIESALPLQLRPYTRYQLPSDYERLYRHLTKQPEFIPPPVGPRLKLGAKNAGAAPPDAGNTKPPTLAQTVLKNFNRAKLRAYRSELFGNVDGIKTAQLAYDAAFDRFVPCSSAKQAHERLTPHLRDWTGGPGWREVGWRPDGPVRGEYWVEVSPDGSKFEVHGIIDADGDGVVAEVVATGDSNARLVTAEDIY